MQVGSVTKKKYQILDEIHISSAYTYDKRVELCTLKKKKKDSARVWLLIYVA